MEGEGQRRSGQASHHKGDQYHPAGVVPVEHVADQGLGDPVDQPTRGGGYGDGGAAPVEGIAHRDDENPEAVPGPSRDCGDKHSRDDYVPAIVHPGLFGVALINQWALGNL